MNWVLDIAPLRSFVPVGSGFPVDAELLLRQARQILSAHEEALRAFGAEPQAALTIGSAEHAAAQPLPELSATLGQTPQGLQPRDDLPAPQTLPLSVWARSGPLSSHLATQGA